MNANTIRNYIDFCLPTGRAALLETIAEYKNYYGVQWLEEFKTDNADFVFVVDIIANNDGESAFVELEKGVEKLIAEQHLPMWQQIAAKQIAKASLQANKANILETARVLRGEIDKPRF